MKRHAVAGVFQRSALSWALLGLAGCAGLNPQAALEPIEQQVYKHTGQTVAVIDTVQEQEASERAIQPLLQQTLTADNAVQVALMNNKDVQVRLRDAGIAQADWVMSQRLPNPRLSLLRTAKTTADGREYKIEQILTFNVFSLLTMPLASEREQRRMKAVQQAVALDILTTASQVRKAWVHAVAASQTLRYAQQVNDAARAGAELGRRMAQVGNWSALAQAREQGFYADAAVGLARAELAHQQALEKLVRLMGVKHPSELRLPDRLPDLPKEKKPVSDFESAALDCRLDLAQMRLNVDTMASQLGLSKVTRFLNVVELGPAKVLEGERNSGFKRGYELSFELPLFDWGESRVARAQSMYMQTLYQTAHQINVARSEIREAYAGYSAQFDIARHYRDEIVPLRKRISDENMLRYNGMFIGVFELLADARAQIGSVSAYIDTLRDFWLADADLGMSLIGSPEFRSAVAAPAMGGDTANAH